MTVQISPTPQIGQLVSVRNYDKSSTGVFIVKQVIERNGYITIRGLKIMDSKGKLFKKPKVEQTATFNPTRDKIVDDKFIDDMFQRDVELARQRAHHLSSNLGL